MPAYPLEIIIPVFNERENIDQVLNQFQNLVNTKFRILICYDNEDDTTLMAYNSKNYDFSDLKISKKTKIIRSKNFGNGAGINIALKNISPAFSKISK